MAILSGHVESVESAENLTKTKTATRGKLDALREAIEADADGRSEEN